MSENDNILGNNIKYLRKTFGLTQKELASELNFDPTSIHRYEKGKDNPTKGRNPNIDTIQKIADYFHVSLEDLLNTDLSQYKLKESLDDIVTSFNNPNDLCDIVIALIDIFPLCSSEEAEKNENFKKGYLLSQNYKDFFYDTRENIEKILSYFNLYNEFQNNPKKFHEIERLSSDEEILKENIQKNTNKIKEIEQYLKNIFHKNSLIEIIKNMNEIIDELNKIEYRLNTKYSDFDQILKNAFHYYSLAKENDNLPESIVNMLWCLYIFGIVQFIDDSKSTHLFKKIISHEVTNSDFLKTPNNSINNSEKTNFIHKYESTINSLIKELKTSKEWSDMADYYYALRYIFNLINNDYSAEENRNFGLKLLNSYYDFGNSVVIKYYDKFFCQFVK